ncbi:MAG: acetyl-CoA C-acetyltransferase [Actinomycetota bacterium]|nr:acetyl-CoA C-acetyltransferase [Actinomycetota bacterium]
MPEAVICAYRRSPIGRAFRGSMTEMRPDDLSAVIIRAALAQIPGLDPADIDDLMLGCGLPGGEQGFNLGRVAAILLGLDRLPGVTLTRYCASSLQTTRMAYHAVKAGEGEVFISAGVEMVSRYVTGHSDSLPGTRNSRFEEAERRSEERGRGGAEEWCDPRGWGALPDVYIAMGQTAENVAQLRNVSRQEQDEFACRSQRLYAKAFADGFWEHEIEPITLPNGQVLSQDDSPRTNTAIERLAELRPVFRRDGTVTAGNSCPLNDGAAAVIVMSDGKARELGVTPLGRIVSTGVSALSPEIMGLGPVEASLQALQRAGMTIDDVDLVELNEAFAAQAIASYRDLGVDLDKLNVHGGSIALGHPFGMSGARLTGTLLNGLQSEDGSVGLATMCAGGGQGMAMIVERLS